MQNTHNLISTFEENLYENNIHHCQYYEEAEVNEKFNCLKTEQFSILSLKIQSLPGKWLEFNNFLSAITMEEIWNKPSHMDFDLTGYHPFHFTIRDK